MNNLLFIMRSKVQHYNKKRYWKYRKVVIDKNSNIPLIVKILLLFYIKRSDAFNNASLGTEINQGANFKDIPSFPHGLYGIIVSKNSNIGKNCTIFHQVTIGEGVGGAPTIGNNCYIGAGAKIIGNVKIGNNVKIGANCIVVEDIPDNSTVVMNKPKILVRKEKNVNE